MSQSDKFGRDFFESGKRKPWLYKDYEYEELYPLFRFAATVIKTQFEPERVLDVGCAKGFLVKAFKDMGIEAWGVDVSEYALSTAPDDVRKFLYKVDMNKDALPFADGYFDCIAFLGTIECLDSHEKILSELRRVMQPGAGMYIRTAYRTDPEDTIRRNVHGRGYWLKEFCSYGFKLLPTWQGPFANQWSYGTLLFERK
jgi:ubiquinone/menaquinone biosynthesis C-methylase UbiE